MSEEILCVTQWRKAQHTWAYVSIYNASKVQNLPLHFNGKHKIAYERGNFVRYAVTESAAYLSVCEHLRRK